MNNLNEEVDLMLENSLEEYYKASNLKGFAKRGLTDKEKEGASALARAKMPTVDIYKGKGGKSAQSLLDKLGVDKQIKVSILKALEADLEKAGFNALEETKRETVSLDATLKLLQKITDPVQLLRARKGIIAYLRANKIRLDPKSSKELIHTDEPEFEIHSPGEDDPPKPRKVPDAVELPSSDEEPSEPQPPDDPTRDNCGDYFESISDYYRAQGAGPAAARAEAFERLKAAGCRSHLAEGRDLIGITIDFEELKQNKLNESFLAMFGGWVEHILGAMFGGRSLPVSVKGSRRDVESFAKALGGEKSYLEAARRYGLDHPTTYKNKAKLENAIKGFEKDTGLKWPFE